MLGPAFLGTSSISAAAGSGNVTDEAVKQHIEDKSTSDDNFKVDGEVIVFTGTAWNTPPES
jgi:hypothetical protein